MRRRLACCAASAAALLALASAPPHARAQDRSPSRVFANDWSRGRTRAFLAWGASLGSTSRADLTVGYGKPYWTYVALESEGTSTPDAALTRLRARLALVVADLSIGWSRAWAYKHTLLPRAARYDDLTVPGQADARYRTLQIALAGFIPAPGGYVDWQTETLRVAGPSAQQAVYEEQLRTVVFPRWAFVGRLGYSYQFAGKQAALGALSEGVWPGERDDYVARVGPVFSWAFSPSLDVSAVVMMTVHTPDALPVYDDLAGNIRVRYRGATGAGR